MNNKTQKSELPQKERSKYGILGNLIYWIFVLLAMTMCCSHIVTDTISLGYPLMGYRKLAHTLLGKEIVLTEEELKLFDGSDPEKSVYLAINGQVFDVTDGREHYGPGGGYSFFAGRDAARAYVTGCFREHLTHDLRGLSAEELTSLSTWIKFYNNHAKYFYVGKVIHKPIDPKSPEPSPCRGPSKPH